MTFWMTFWMTFFLHYRKRGPVNALQMRLQG